MDAMTPAPIANFPCYPAKGSAESDLNVWRGLPYALPPSGDRRCSKA